MNGMTIKVASVIGVWGVLLLSAACGDSDGGGGSVSSGLPADQKLSTLTDADAMKACQAVSDSVGAVITPDAITRAQCASAAISASIEAENGELTVDTAQCQQLNDACVKNPPKTTEEDDDDGDCKSATVDDGLKTCEATVREYEACLNDVLQQLQERLAMLTCANGEKIANEDEDDAGDLSSIPSCKSLKGKCPALPLTVPVETD